MSQRFEDKVQELFGENVNELKLLHNCPRIFLLNVDSDTLRYVKGEDEFYTLRYDERDILKEGVEAMKQFGYDIIHEKMYADDDWEETIFILKER